MRGVHGGQADGGRGRRRLGRRIGGRRGETVGARQGGERVEKLSFSIVPLLVLSLGSFRPTAGNVA